MELAAQLKDVLTRVNEYVRSIEDLAVSERLNREIPPEDRPPFPAEGTSSHWWTEWVRIGNEYTNINGNVRSLKSELAKMFPNLDIQCTNGGGYTKRWRDIVDQLSDDPQDESDPMLKSLGTLKFLRKLKPLLEECRNDLVVPSAPVPKQRPGPKQNIERHRKIAQAALSAPEPWKSHLLEIATKLDDENVPVVPAWAKFKPLVRTWTSAVKKKKQLVIKAIGHSLDKHRESPPS